MTNFKSKKKYEFFNGPLMWRRNRHAHLQKQTTKLYNLTNKRFTAVVETVRIRRLSQTMDCKITG